MSQPRHKPHGDECRENKLFVGNLDHRLTEFHLMKLLQKFGAIKHFDYMWHTYGPKKGQPRGYCFVEYVMHEDAVAAQVSLNGKIALGRKLLVQFAEHKTGRSGSTDKNPGMNQYDLNKASTSTKIQVLRTKLGLLGDQVDSRPLSVSPQPEKHSSAATHTETQSTERIHTDKQSTEPTHAEEQISTTTHTADSPISDILRRDDSNTPS